MVSPSARLAGVPVRWRLWLLYVTLLGGVLLLLGLALGRQVDRLLVDAAIEHTRARAATVIDREVTPPELQNPSAQFKPQVFPPRRPIVVNPPGPGQPAAPGQPNPGAGQGAGQRPPQPGGARPDGQPVPGGPGQPQFPGPDNRSPVPMMERAALSVAFEVGSADVQVTAFRPDGTLLTASPAPLDADHWPWPAVEEVQRALGGASVTRVVEGSPRAALTIVPVRTPAGEVIGVVGLATSLEVADAATDAIRLALVLAGLAAAGLGALVGVPATRALLSPLDKVVAVAERVSAGELSTRAGLGDRPDEVGRLARAFDRMLDRLHAALEAQRRFVADASHELKSPLTGLGGMVEILGQVGDDNEQRRRAIKAMEREIERMNRLVADLLTLSRLDANANLARRPVDLAAVVTEVVEARRLLGAPPIHLGLEARPIVAGDAEALARLVRNLLDNAIAATAGGGQIAIGVEVDAERARVRVADDGVGIPAEALPHLFERFYRVDPARPRRTGGTGLGLAIVQGIAQAHGGRVAAASDGPGRGAVFTLELPVTPAPASGGRTEPSEPGVDRHVQVSP